MVQAPYTLEQAEEDISSLRGQLAYQGEVGSALNFGINGATGAQFVNNTANAASFVTIASGTVPANNALSPGACYELYCTGTAAWGSPQQALTLQVQFGGNAMTSTGLTANAFAANQANIRWQMRARVYCAATGASGSFTSELTGVWACSGTLNGVQGSTSASIAVGYSDTPSPTTIDTTSAQTLNLQAQWASATGSPSMACRLIAFSRIA